MKTPTSFKQLLYMLIAAFSVMLFVGAASTQAAHATVVAYSVDTPHTVYANTANCTACHQPSAYVTADDQPVDTDAGQNTPVQRTVYAVQGLTHQQRNTQPDRVMHWAVWRSTLV